MQTCVQALLAANNMLPASFGSTPGGPAATAAGASCTTHVTPPSLASLADAVPQILPGTAGVTQVSLLLHSNSLLHIQYACCQSYAWLQDQALICINRECACRWPRRAHLRMRPPAQVPT